MLTEARAADFAPLYAILQKSLPPAERRQEADQRSLIGREGYHLLACHNEGALAGMMGVWELEGFLFLEHFAVDEALRGRGVGSALLRELFERFPSPVLLEAEPPQQSPLAARRVRFYERHGFCQNPYPYLQPSYGGDRPALPLVVMTRPEPLSRQAFDARVAALYRAPYASCRIPR